MEERNRNKKFRIGSVYYESSMLEPKDDYSQEQHEEIVALVGKWSSFDFDKTDAYIYFDDLEKNWFLQCLRQRTGKGLSII